ncbi:hypothetical protein N6H05_23845 [Sphingobium sp. WTD-1]|uniref:hypothetical protein n=1 Tax=Sphingobium sp. WTD-1 TaxID=2979467 RepID=UPI0024DE7944|nr:hypothetical protein [Sphingobium sp. WTD-1]WIA56013.1 hypothetical protein N6H05_23845 [Sphingobium sp. WTD-1]
MAVTLEQVDTFHAERQHSEWAAIADDAQRSALIVRALDFVEANYAPLVEGAETQPRYLMSVALLALRLFQSPDTGTAKPSVKSEKKEMRGMKKEVEYFEPSSIDPFPGVTKLIEPLKQPAIAAPCVSFGKLTR